MDSLLLVCTGNICRSPMAEAVFRERLPELRRVASAGLRAAPRGEPVDPRAAAVLARQGLALPKRWRSQRVEPALLEDFDLVLAMDLDNHAALRRLQPAATHVQLFMDLLPGRAGEEVPDPYYGPPQGFDTVLSLIEQGAAALRQRLRG